MTTEQLLEMTLLELVQVRESMFSKEKENDSLREMLRRNEEQAAAREEKLRQFFENLNQQNQEILKQQLSEQKK